MNCPSCGAASEHWKIASLEMRRRINDVNEQLYYLGKMYHDTAISAPPLPGMNGWSSVMSGKRRVIDDNPLNSYDGGRPDEL
ncbi:Uncharacterised protein [uncultured archaeon]|nr:Uncharacterised protein [uncultured archaeon]